MAEQLSLPRLVVGWPSRDTDTDSYESDGGNGASKRKGRGQQVSVAVRDRRGRLLSLLEQANRRTRALAVS